jgi:hypothetical protein
MVVQFSTQHVSPRIKVATTPIRSTTSSHITRPISIKNFHRAVGQQKSTSQFASPRVEQDIKIKQMGYQQQIDFYEIQKFKLENQ